MNCINCNQETPNTHFCSRKCSGLYNTPFKPVDPDLRPCLACKLPTTNPKFCSRSCSTSYSNSLKPKRTKRENNCHQCNILITNSRNKYCSDCFRQSRASIRTLGDIQKAAKYQINAQIRGLARNIYKSSGRPYICAICRYDKHVDICHIKDINLFSSGDLLSAINSLKNLIALCKNCHWEFDHNLL